MIGVRHVYPINDLREHQTEGESCWCQPRIEEDGKLIIHNALDQRERSEQRGKADA